MICNCQFNDLLSICGKTALAFVSLLIAVIGGYGQKPPIDTSILGKWPVVRNGAISNDGNYVTYTIYNQPANSKTVYLKSTRFNWNKTLLGAVENGKFTNDNRFFIYTKSRDTLCILLLGTSSLSVIPNVSSFQVFNKHNHELLLYKLNVEDKDLILRDLNNGSENQFSKIENYYLDKNFNSLVIETGHADSGNVCLSLVDLNDRKISTIFQRGTYKTRGVAFDTSGFKVAYLLENDKPERGKKGSSLWFYQRGEAHPTMIADCSSVGIDSNLVIGTSGLKVSEDGKRVFFHLKEYSQPSLLPSSASVDVWSYKDIKLQSQQLKEVAPQQYLAVVDISKGKVLRIQQEHESVSFFPGLKDEQVFISRYEGLGNQEYHWNRASKAKYYFMSTVNGQRKSFPMGVINVSPQGRYAICSNENGKDFYSYELSTSIFRNITPTLSAISGSRKKTYSNEKEIRLRGIAGWSSDYESVLVHDGFDYWKLELSKNRCFASVTNEYGRKNNIELNLIGIGSLQTFSDNDTLIFQAFDKVSKVSGFFYKRFSQIGEPISISMGPYSYSHPSVIANQKARSAQVYLLARSSATESENYFITRDFKLFESVSDIHFENKYNWLTCELVKWKRFDGKTLEGLLYKPENFDPHKKYPIIFTYYERYSDNLNKFLIPDDVQDRINIPWFVSNGYIVFCPDILYEIGATGHSASTSVVSAAKYLSRIPWIDPRRMGLQGHSFGGYETNYIVTQTSLFAAAMSAAGTSNLVSSYGSLWHTGASKQHMYEIDQYRLGTTPWQDPNIYVRNTPIFYADRVHSPVLFMNNREDGGVNFSQGVEYFTALRRLQKMVWLLQYDGEGHSLQTTNAKRDYSIRISQFFNHYLKHAPAPLWMTQGIPARLKQVITGYDLDPSNSCGNDCKVCKRWNEKWAKDSVETKQLIEKEEKNHWMGLLETVEPEVRNQNIDVGIKKTIQSKSANK